MSCAEKARCKPRHSLLLATDEEDLIHKKWRQERPKFFYKCRPFSFSLAPPEEVKEEDEIQPLKEEVVVERVEEVCEEVASNKQKERNHYFGREARHAFFEKFNEVDARPATVFSRDASPREKFARALVAKLQIVREQANELGSDADFCLPEPIFVRSTQADSLMIGHRSYGDAAAVLLADIINDLPNLRHLSMRDNRLTDRGTAAILDAVCCGGSDNNTTNNAAGTAKRLLSLDLSMNVLDTDAVISIANFLRRSDCQLESLSLESADIDDNEISLLVLALDENKSLKELSIPHNYLGGFAEKLLVNEKRRGSLTIERVLKANSTLRKLDLSWNQLGSISGEAIARALGENRALTWLSIAYNCIGDEGSMAFGYALNWNKSLTFLDMSHNGIRNRGGQVIAEGLRENLRLTHLDVSGNPVGKLGGRALIKSLNLSLRQRKIVMRACDFAEDDTEQGRFNPASPAGTYRLDMSRPHDWMIAQSLLTLTVLRPGCKFVQLAETTSKNGEPRQIHLVDPRMDQRSSKRVSARSKDDGERSSNNSAKAAIAKMRQRIKSATQGETYESFIARNARTTSFGPGDFRKMVRELVMISAATISDAEILQLFSRIDSDNSGTIDANELEAFVTNRDKAYMAASTLQARFRGAIARIDMSQIKRMFEGGIQSTDKNESSLEKPRNRLLSARRHSIVKQKSPSQLSKAKFRAFSRFAVASSREMRAHMRALIPLDSKTMKPWKVPAPPAIITATFEEIPLPPTELSIHNATGINSLLTLLMDDCADRLALLRLASTDLRLFSIQVTQIVFNKPLSSNRCNTSSTASRGAPDLSTETRCSKCSYYCFLELST